MKSKFSFIKSSQFSALFFFSIFLFGLSGCNSEKDNQLIAYSNKGNYEVQIQSNPDSIPLNDLFELIVAIKPVKSNHKGNINIQVETDMPSHGHGMHVEPIIEEVGNFEYLVKGMLFHMPGEWEINIHINNNNITEIANFKITL